LSTIEFSFGQIEAVCADLNRIASDKRVAFMGRMKQLQKQGLTHKGKRPGRGKAGSYSFGDLMRFVIAVELIQAGIMPQMAARLVNGSWDLLRTNIYVCSFAPEDTIGFAKKPTEYLWMLDVEALRSLTRRGEHESDYMERIQAVPLEEAAKALTEGLSTDPEVFGESWRTLVLNGHNLTQRVMKNIAFNFGWATRQELRDDIEAEIDAHNAELRRFSEELDNLPPMSPEKRADFERRMRDIMDADYSTNPPTPRHVLVERARDIIKFLPDDLRGLLAGPPQTSFKLDDETKALVKLLIDFGLIEIELVEGPDGYNLQAIVQTPLGMAVIEELGGEWGEALKKGRTEKPHDPLDDDADAIIAELSEEQRQAIRSRDDNWVKEPLRSEFQRLNLIEVEEGDLPDTKVFSWTELGRAVSFALRFGRHRRRSEKALANGDDQTA
jgi:hypothetical protein